MRAVLVSYVTRPCLGDDEPHTALLVCMVSPAVLLDKSEDGVIATDRLGHGSTGRLVRARSGVGRRRLSTVRIDPYDAEWYERAEMALSRRGSRLSPGPGPR